VIEYGLPLPLHVMCIENLVKFGGSRQPVTGRLTTHASNTIVKTYMHANRQANSQTDRHTDKYTLAQYSGLTTAFERCTFTMIHAIGASSQSCWEGPNLLFLVRGEVRWAEARGPKGREQGWGSSGWGSQPPPHQLAGLGERCKLPQRGPGRSPGR